MTKSNYHLNTRLKAGDFLYAKPQLCNAIGVSSDKALQIKKVAYKKRQYEYEVPIFCYGTLMTYFFTESNIDILETNKLYVSSFEKTSPQKLPDI